MGNASTPEPAGSEAGTFFREAGGRAIYLRHRFLPGDVGRVIRLHGEVYGKEHGLGAVFEGYVAQTVGAFAAKKPHATSETGERIWLLSADQSRELVGCCAVVDEGNGRAQFRWFLTHPTVRGMGLGRALLTEAVAFARGAGYREMFLLTGDFLPAAAHLYRDLGFRLVEERPFEGWDFSFVERTYSLDLSGE